MWDAFCMCMFMFACTWFMSDRLNLKCMCPWHLVACLCTSLTFVLAYTSLTLTLCICWYGYFYVHLTLHQGSRFNCHSTSQLYNSTTTVVNCSPLRLHKKSNCMSTCVGGVCYLDPYLYSAWLFIMPVLLMLQRRIQCCWLFLFQPFHMQPPPLLTLPLILDHRWKSSSHPADALRFWWVFFFQLQVREEQQDNWFYWCREKTAAAFIPVFSSHFSSAHTCSLQQ